MSANIFESIVGTDPSQTNPYFMCQPLPRGLHTQWDLDKQTNRFVSRQNKTFGFELWSCTLSNQQNRIAKMRASSSQQAGWKKMTASVLMVFVLIATLLSKQWAAFITLVFVKKSNCLSLKKRLNVLVKKELSELRRNYIEKNTSLSLKCWSVKG